MSKTWFTSDHHFFHSNILKFTDSQGNLVRPGFEDVHHMNEHMIQKWNEKISQDDKVYHLGDVIMKTSRESFEKIIPRLNGRIVLIKGNHDLAKLSIYSDFFRDVRSEIHLKSSDKRHMIVFSHRPIYLAEPHFFNKSIFNVHGHTHHYRLPDNRYINVCVECTNYDPIEFDEIQSMIERIVK